MSRYVCLRRCYHRGGGYTRTGAYTMKRCPGTNQTPNNRVAHSSLGDPLGPIVSTELQFARCGRRALSPLANDLLKVPPQQVQAHDNEILIKDQGVFHARSPFVLVFSYAAVYAQRAYADNCASSKCRATFQVVLVFPWVQGIVHASLPGEYPRQKSDRRGEKYSFQYAGVRSPATRGKSSELDAGISKEYRETIARRGVLKMARKWQGQENCLRMFGILVESAEVSQGF